jgi:hypothetical protein
MSDVYDKLDNTTQPDLQAAKLGTLIEGAPVVVKVVIDADYTGEKSVTIPYDMEVIDVVVQCTAANSGGTLTLENGGHAVTDAMICAVDTTIVRAATIDDAYSTLYTTSTVTVDAHGANDRGIMWIIGYRI